ncbi:MAG: N-formylglutamate deformylase [Halobacteriovoraceae bacterium]|jgi:N-formylglutamate deformylase|nr:N-formylglutamate deformylase [Halobacteriovoraceae bacterium]MBT5093189.1 N-formylglutamate deformylase [Halobacteriovoraceae bacterium]
MHQPFILNKPVQIKYPILVSCPHVGTHFPKGLTEKFQTGHVEAPEDTDWHVHQLYNFSTGLGIPLLRSYYSRYVLDLNRPKTEEKLYQDGRVESGLFPTHTFSGKALYKNEQQIIGPEDKKDRLHNFYFPYHQQISKILMEMKNEFGVALLLEAHSIKSDAPFGEEGRLPHLILGNQEGVTCHPSLMGIAKTALEQNELGFKVVANHPFKGGFLTRKFGRPEASIHALQLEMCQDVYMNESDNSYSREKAQKIEGNLILMLENLGRKLLELGE